MSSVPGPHEERINRRSLLLGAVFLLGGAAALTRFARQAPAGAAAGPALSPDQFALLEQVAETLIPASDTPGAIDAGVPEFMRQMLADWGSPQTHAGFVAVLDEIDRQAWKRHGAGFVSLPPERRLDVMKGIDAEGIDRQDVGYRKFKWLVLVSYYQSEPGATQELRYELVPGAWRPCLPLSEVGRASAV